MKPFLLCLTFITAMVSGAFAQLTDPALLRDPEIVSAFQSLPIQEGGRVKPLDTYARFLLLRLHGKQSIAVEHPQLEGVKKLSATEWLLLSWFRPDIARDLPLFVVDNSQAVGEIGVDPKGLRDRYSWNEIVKGREKLVELATQYGNTIEVKDRTAVHRNVIDLARNFVDFDAVSDFLTSSRTNWKAEIEKIVPPEAAKELIGDKPTLDVWDLSLRLGGVIRENRMASLGGQEAADKLLQLFIDTTLRPAKTLTFLPPDDASNDTWMTVEDTLTRMMRAGPQTDAATNPEGVSPGDLRLSKAKEGLLTASTQATTFKQAVKDFVRDVRDQVGKRAVRKKKIQPYVLALNAKLKDLGELKALLSSSTNISYPVQENQLAELEKKLGEQKITINGDQAEVRSEAAQVDREVKFYKRDDFTYALVYYLFGFLIGILGLVAPGSKWARISAWVAGLALAAGIYHNTYGIIQRCLINDRPPIATLYETIIFIAGCVALVGLILEVITRRGIGQMVGGLIGALGMFMAMRFMELDKQDTMPTLEAVLITNFWLATHVTCINIGYAGAMLGAVISLVWVVFRTISAAKGGTLKDDLRFVTRITYGIVCFGVLFALVGTVLGGIWANDSWGRFWGWDPKENGALMIVLMGLIILHARLGGYVREAGLHCLSLILGAITLFSWFGVNQLNVGLHSYGFTAGISLALNIGYAVFGASAFLALVFAWQDRATRAAASHTPPPLPDDPVHLSKESA